MTNLIYPVIMAGGTGTRLWPLSRSTSPKQFLYLNQNLSLYQQSLARVVHKSGYAPPIVITNEGQGFIAAEQASAMGIELSTIILEPIARNTSAAIAAAAHYVRKTFGKDAILQIMPSDHAIEDGASWDLSCANAIRLAEKGQIVTFGIAPTEPATGYGYIERGTSISDFGFRVRKFIEKPNALAAQKLISTGNHLWNSGIFMARVDTLLSELLQLAPEIFTASYDAVKSALVDKGFVHLSHVYFAQSPNISFDYAVMERTRVAAVVDATFDWSDLGTWDAVWKKAVKDELENVVVGKATLVDTYRSIVISNNAHIVVHGITNMAVVASEDAVYVGNLASAQSVGKIVTALGESEATLGLI